MVDLLPDSDDSAREKLRRYLQATLYAVPDEGEQPRPDSRKLSFVLVVERPIAPFTGADVFTSRLPVADRGGGHASLEEDGSPRIIALGYSDHDPVGNQAAGAERNRRMLAAQPATVADPTPIPATVMRTLIERDLAALDPAFAQAVEDIGRQVSAVKLTRRRKCVARHVRRVNQHALDALVGLCRRWIASQVGKVGPRMSA